MKTTSLFALLLFWTGFILINGIHNTIALGLSVAVAVTFLTKAFLFIRQIITRHYLPKRINHWA